MSTLRATLLATLLVAGTGTAAMAQSTTNGATGAQNPPAATTAPVPVAPAPADSGMTATGTSGASSAVDDRGGAGWGWIGLVGLVGLAGLMRRPDRRVGAYDTVPADTAYGPGSRTAP